jgi:hypothetical protein
MLLFGVISCIAQTNSAAQVGAAVENIRFEKGTRIAFVRVTNTSNKDITGFNLSVAVTYQNGRQYHYERLVDFLPKMLARQKQSLADDGALHPGDQYEERFDLPSHGDPNNLAIAVSAKLDVAAYSDHSVDVVNEPALLRLTGTRHNWALADQKAAEIINAAVANSITPDPRGMALTQLRAVLEQAKRKDGERELEVELMAIIADLERRGPATSKFDLRLYATSKYGDSEALASHVLLRRSK